MGLKVENEPHKEKEKPMSDIKITSVRQAELLEIYTDEIHEPGSCWVRDPGEYTSWDDLLEDEDSPLTFEEWEWCRDNFEVTVTVSVKYKEPA